MTTLFYLSYAAMWLLLLAQGLLLLLLYRHFGLITLGTEEGVQRDGLPVGELAPAIRGTTAEGTTVGWHPRPGHAELVLFATPDCAPCAQVMPAVGALHRHNPSLGIAVIVPGRDRGIARFVEKFRPSFPCFADERRQSFDGYRVRVTPFAFVIGADGRIRAKGLCGTPSRLRTLLASAGVDGGVAAAAPLLMPTGNGVGASAGAKEVRDGAQ